MTDIHGSQTLSGIAGSSGIVVAVAVVLDDDRAGVRRHNIDSSGIDEELQRFVEAVAEVQKDLRATLAAMPKGRPEASILGAYIMMVGDEMLANLVEAEVRDRLRCADWAVAEAASALASQLGDVEDPYICERSHDIEFVGERLLRALGGRTRDQTDLQIAEPSIVVARDLSPADTAAMARTPVVGFVTEVGSRTNHTSIMARALEIPAVVGVSDALQNISSGDLVILDGLRGQVVVRPSSEEVQEAEHRAERYQSMARKLGESSGLPALTQDGMRVVLHANIEFPREAKVARQHGAEGIGLYRTEFLYIDRMAPPSEQEQLDGFRKVVKAMDGSPVTLRTFDIGGDKFATTFRMPEELNPMLGLRAVRLALSERAVFLEHLRAMLRASAYGPIRIMIPLVATLEEFRVVRELLSEAQQELSEQGYPVAEHIPLGVMIEVPAAAIMADAFAEEVEFMSIGTNDLVQYSLAVDRTNRTLAHLASPFEPGIIRLIHHVVKAATASSCPLSLCGEMASDPLGAVLLLGLGLRDLSMESVAIPEIKEAISRVKLGEAEELAAKALKCTTAAEVLLLLNDALEVRLHDLLTGQPTSTPAPSSVGRRGNGES